MEKPFPVLACQHTEPSPVLHWAKESDYRSIQKTAENDLYSFGEGAVLRSQLRGKSLRMNTAPI